MPSQRNQYSTDDIALIAGDRVFALFWFKVDDSATDHRSTGKDNCSAFHVDMGGDYKRYLQRVTYDKFIEDIAESVLHGHTHIIKNVEPYFVEDDGEIGV